MLEDGTPVDSDPVDDEVEVPPTPDIVFALRLRDALESFTTRQSEVLRLATFMDERAAEIDNATARARDLISAQIGDIDENAVDKLIRVFTDVSEADLGDDDLAPEDRAQAFANAFHEVTAALPDGLVSTYMDGVFRAMYAPAGVGILHSSLLVTLVGELEVFVNVVARACFEKQPSALDGSGKEFKWSDIAAFESIDEMRDYVVDQAIEDVLRGSLTDWMDYFVKRFKIAAIDAAEEASAQEAIQRRHCIVHNAAQVSSTYLEKLARYQPSLKVGDDLEVDSAYLRHAADTLYMVAFSLAWSLGYKMLREDDAISIHSSAVSNRTYFLLFERRYDLIRQICAKAPVDKIDELAAFVIRVNGWLAHKFDGTFDKVRAEVEALDVRSRSRDFNLAKLALLDRNEEAYALAQAMIRDEELRPEFLFTWPLLSGVRDHARRRAGLDS